MSVSSEEQFGTIEPAADAIIPTSAFENIVIHHESLILEEMRNIVEKVGGEICGEIHYV